ncbi:hypothetical protein [Pseudemcibacter aquimaris]|nr:hypothetical protein [Pseudemcibacter aquimaris]MCC3860162.1 hypothetical protein [Pseudemcibacter aquimaris]WDU57489.1 hypothetical protein KW060_09800 [Pseudemcibacter aquimaris]
MNFYNLDELPPSDAGELTSFYQLWNKLRDGKKIPSRQDYTFENLKGWHTNIRLVDLGEEINSPKHNIILGETYKRYWGNDTMYNRFVASKDATADNREKYLKSLGCFMNYHYAISVGNSPKLDNPLRQVAWIDLPLSNGNNDEISFLLTALIPLEE